LEAAVAVALLLFERLLIALSEGAVVMPGGGGGGGGGVVLELELNEDEATGGADDGDGKGAAADDGVVNRVLACNGFAQAFMGDAFMASMRV
jgi:hypothetical protein